MKATVHHINPDTTVKAWYKAAAPRVEQGDLIRPNVTFDTIIRYGKNDPARVCELLGVTDIELAEDVLNEVILVLHHMEGRYKYRSLSELKARHKMKKELTITFLLDSEWDNEDGQKCSMDEEELLLYALEQVRDASRVVEGFEKAEYNGMLLLSKDGDAPESVKKTTLYKRILREMQTNL